MFNKGYHQSRNVERIPMVLAINKLQQVFEGSGKVQ